MVPHRRQRLTDKMVTALPARETRYTVPDPGLVGHYVRVTPSGAKSFVAVARDPYGKQVWATIEAADKLGIDEARDRARDIIKRIKAGLPPVEPPPTKPDSFKAVAENWLKRHVASKGLRTGKEIRRILEKYILPAWANRNFVEIGRSDMARLLDHVEDEHGPRQADQVLGTVRAIANWYATRADKYSPPFVRGMRRTDPKASKRSRILDDAELRAVWKQAEQNGTFGAIIRLALLTAQRREKIASMKWGDVTIDGVWNIPAEDREKGTGGALVLPDKAIEIIRAQHRIEGSPYVFTGQRTTRHFVGFSACKKAFDKKLPPMPGWRLHDLRRSARSLLSRAGVSSEHAERVMGHVIGGVEGIYDRHRYDDEKRIALAKLAALVGEIVNGG